MYVHLGGDAVVDVREVVAILDARRVRTAEARALLARAGIRSRGPRPRAIVVTPRGVYPTPVTAATVARRIARAGARGAQRRESRRDGGCLSKVEGSS
jgi:hypothetical protein